MVHKEQMQQNLTKQCDFHIYKVDNYDCIIYFCLTEECGQKQGFFYLKIIISPEFKIFNRSFWIKRLDFLLIVNTLKNKQLFLYYIIHIIFLIRETIIYFYFYFTSIQLGAARCLYCIFNTNQMQRGFQSDRKSTTSSQKKIDDRRLSITLNLQCKDHEALQKKHISPYQSKSNLTLLTNLKSIKKEMSLSPRRGSAIQNDDKSEKDSIGPSNGSTKRDESVSRYQCIASLTEQQNKNLKEQNRYLLQKLRKMQERQLKVRKLYQKAKKYKVLWEEAKIQTQVLKDERQIYKEQAQQMKKIILNDVCRLKKKVLETQIEQKFPQTQQNYQLQSKKSQINSQASTTHKSARVTSSTNLIKYTPSYLEQI